MHGSKVDKKSKELIKLISFLREDIDVHRIVGLNTDALSETGISRPIFGYLQVSALHSLAVSFCKIFEASSRNDLNSIPGIIDSLPSMNLSSEQKKQFSGFGLQHGNNSEPVDAKIYLGDTFNIFSAAHAAALEHLKEYRDTIGAHSDFNASREFLPSHAEFEILYDFALRFYQLIADSIIKVNAANAPRRVAPSLVALMKKIGISTPQTDFKPKV